MADFNPNRNTLEEGIEIVRQAIANSNVPTDRIITSRSSAVIRTKAELAVSNIPGGFKKWQLPAMFDGPSLMYMSVGSPGVHVPEHSHDEGNGIRVIITGSIRYGDEELTTGDWMYLPKGAKYSFDVGDDGVTMFYCYQCCCR